MPFQGDFFFGVERFIAETINDKISIAAF